MNFIGPRATQVLRKIAAYFETRTHRQGRRVIVEEMPAVEAVRKEGRRPVPGQDRL